LGQSLGQPANAQTDWADPGAAEGPKNPTETRCFSFTNMLPPVVSDDSTEPTPSKLSLPAASLPQPREAANDGYQTDKASASSGLTFTNTLPPAAMHAAKEPSSATPSNDPASNAGEATKDAHQGEIDSAAVDTQAHAATGTQQAAVHAAEQSELSALYELYDSESLILNSLSLCSPGTQELVPIPAQPGPSVAHGRFANMLPESDEQHSMLSSSACTALELGRPCEAAAEGDVEAAQSYSKHGMFANMLPQPDEQHRRFSSSAGTPSAVEAPRIGADTKQLPNKAPGSSKTEALPEAAGVRAEEPSKTHRAAATGISRRELFRQKLAAAQAAQLDRSSPELVVPSPEAAPKVSAAKDQDTSTPRSGRDTYGILAPSAQAAAALPELSSLPAPAADDEGGAPDERAEGADSKIDSKKTDLPPLMQGLSSDAAAPPGSNHLDESAQDVASAGAPIEDSGRTTSEPEASAPDQAGLPDQAALDIDAAVQWAENAAAGESNTPDQALGFAIRRVSAAAHESAPSPADAHSAVCRSPAAEAFQDDRLHRRGMKGEGAELEVEDSVSSIGSEAECSGMPLDAGADDDTAVHWAVNAANVDAAALDGDEPDEALEFVVHRMSAAVRESAPAAGQGYSARSRTSLVGASSSEDLRSSADSDKDADLAENFSRHSDRESDCSAIEAPNEAAEGTDTAVHWAENAASSDAVAQNDQEPEEALLQAIRRMSAVARERVKESPEGSPAAESAQPLMDHARYSNHSGGQQGMAWQSSSASPAILPSLQHASDSAQSPISASEPGSEQPGKTTVSKDSWGSASKTGSGQHALHKKQSGCIFEEGCEQGPDAGQAGQASGSPAGASYEQLLTRFKGSPAPDRCFTPPPGFGAQAVTGQDTGERSTVPLKTGQATDSWSWKSSPIGRSPDMKSQA